MDGGLITVYDFNYNSTSVIHIQYISMEHPGLSRTIHQA